MTEKEASDLLQDTLLNKSLEDIHVYNHDQPYVFLEDRDAIIVSAGIELKLNSKGLALLWNPESQIFNLQYEDTVADDHLQDVEIKNLDSFQKLIGQSITGIKAKWNFYQNLNEDQELEEEKFYVPQEILLEFDNGQVLQIATINYGLDVQQNNIFDLNYDITSDLLVTLNPYSDIQENAVSDLMP